MSINSTLFACVSILCGRKLTSACEPASLRAKSPHKLAPSSFDLLPEAVGLGRVLVVIGANTLGPLLLFHSHTWRAPSRLWSELASSESDLDVRAAGWLGARGAHNRVASGSVCACAPLAGAQVGPAIASCSARHELSWDTYNNQSRVSDNCGISILETINRVANWQAIDAAGKPAAASG